MSYTLEQLWEEFDTLNNQRKKWADNEGTNNEVHKALDESCQHMYDVLHSRFQQIRTIAKCGGCDITNEEGVYSEWNCGTVFMNRFFGVLTGEFYCRTCGCMVRVNTKGEYV